MTCILIAERVESAAHGLDEYAIRKEGRADYDAPETVATDMIADLLHLIVAHGGNADAAISTARMHFEAEQEEEA